MKNRRGMQFVAMTAIFGFILSGCSAEKVGSEGAADKKIDSLTVIHPGNKTLGLSPLLRTDVASLGAMDYLYERLVNRDPETNEIIPELAKSWETSDDETWVFHLQEGVKFHDGTDFNADSVVYVFEKLANDPDSVRPSLLDPVKDITAVDEHTVEFKTDGPYGPFLDVVARDNLGIYSPKADKNGDINSAPVGTGPYKLDEWNDGESVKASVFDEYWRGKPVVETVELREVSDPNTALSLLEKGEADVITGVPYQQAERVENMPNAVIDEVQGTGVAYLSMNTEHAPMNDLEFRRAVNMAVDRDGYIEHLGGFAKRSDSYAASRTFGYDEADDDKGVSYDPDKAKKIIKDNGWDGTELELMTTNEKETKDRAIFLQSELDKAGLDVDLEMLDLATFLERSIKENTDLTLNSWTSSGNSILYDTLHSENIDVSNYARFSDEEVDSLISKSNSTVDEQERKKYLHEANLAAMKKAPWVVLNHSTMTSGISKDVVESVTISPSGGVDVVRRDDDK